MTFHRHVPRFTGRIITAEFGKENLPEHIKPVRSIGHEAACDKCGVMLIVHDPHHNFSQPFTELAA